MANNINTVLFDLDGTLADTAPDLANALNALRSECDLQPRPLAELRPLVSRGANALLRYGLEIDEQHPEHGHFRGRLLDHYESCVAAETTLMAGTTELLERLDRFGIRWGVVTNKPARFTAPLLDALALAPRACCVVSGDTTAHAKPHPAPILEALRRCNAVPPRSLYVGDAETDIRAARAAGVASLVVRYGYIGAEENPETWGANALVDEPLDILTWIGADSPTEFERGGNA
jgi:2-phosphoglycolate phosphatase